MSNPPLPYTFSDKLQSQLILNPPDSVPPTDELELLQAELKGLRQKALERAKKADGDLRVIEGALRKMREKEKGKMKAVARVKRESSHTPSLDAEEISYRGSVPALPSTGSQTPNTHNLHPHSVPSSVARSSPDSRKPSKKKDKDRKRKRDESEGEESPRPRKFSPHPPSSHKEVPHYKPSKLSNSVHSKPDFSMPQHGPLLPPRPPPAPPPVAGPSKPIEVTEDFSKAKAPQQVPVTTFYSSIEPWLRPLREEDVGWLEYTADEVDPFIMPKLGKHYLEQWEEEDIAYYGGVPAALDFAQNRHIHSHNPNAPLPRWDPSTLVDSDLATEKGLGPVTERLVSAFIESADMSLQAVKTAEDAYEAKLASAQMQPSSSNSVPKEKIVVSEFEERIRDAAKFYGLIEGEPDFSQNLDDPVASALRQAQRQLRSVIATNKGRKARLADIARDRLAYQEYVETRDLIDKNITSAFSKLQKKDGPKVNKKKKKSETNGNMNGGNQNGPAPLLPNPASIGLGPDAEGRLFVPENLSSLVDTRRRLVDALGRAFDDVERESPGRVVRFPKRSVFEGIDEEVKEMMKYRWEPLPEKDGSRTDNTSDAMQT